MPTITYLDKEIFITITYYHPGCPAKTNADPAYCYPADPAEIDFKIADNQKHKRFFEHMLDLDSEFQESVENQLLLELANDRI